ncbi:DoxX family protein [Uliginosibacterium sp. 31-12]|uniref:DoxX family protein n=1 Tax=Uliginosibacterium sp. 31-12 TaxID=3062781 RepID=UPI0026E37D91|nr:DoxX family protein [Uliginosibacterium sp. 31-12]MDO6386592.1 DoxX family protein [Uliginosibacterium sp. 31-12]
MNCALPAGLCRAYESALAALRDMLLLALRLYIAWVFFKSGLTKIEDWSSTLALFEYEYSVPLLPTTLAAVMGTAGELLLPPLLALGLVTRFAALGLTVVNAMAVISYPALWGFECPAAIQSHFFWGAGLLVLLAFGGGRVAADPVVWRKLCGKAPGDCR